MLKHQHQRMDRPDDSEQRRQLNNARLPPDKRQHLADQASTEGQKRMMSDSQQKSPAAVSVQRQDQPEIDVVGEDLVARQPDNGSHNHHQWLCF